MKTKFFYSIITFLLIVNLAFSQKNVTGIITDENGDGIPGATVVVKNTKIVTITNIDGQYSIEVPDSATTLVVSFVGLETTEIQINNANTNVVLKAGEQQIDEIVIHSFGNKKESRKMGYFAVQDESSLKNTKKREHNPKQDYSGIKIKRKNHHYKIVTTNQNISDTESYGKIDENEYKNSLNEPLSTFSVDVDKASYANIRRFINQGTPPPVDAVRIEEMLNYFDYNYPFPTNNQPVSIITEAGKCIWNPEHQLIKIGLKGKLVAQDEAVNNNLVFLIDVSGSMCAENKLPLVKKSLKILIQRLRADDKIAIVVYAGAAGVVLQSTSDKNKVLEALECLEAGGSTAGGQGIELAYKIAMENFIKDGNNRIIIATDGDFNVGLSSESELVRLIENKRESGVFLTILGFGIGNYKDNIMEKLSNAGNGNYAYIDNIKEADKIFGSELLGTLYTIAKDVKIQVEFNPAQVKAYRLIGYENRLLNIDDFNDDTKDAGEIGAGHTVTAFYEIIPTQSVENIPEIDLKYQRKNISESKDIMTIKLRYKNPNGFRSRLIEKSIMKQEIENNPPSTDFQFATAIIGYGMILRNSKYKGNLTLDQIIEIADKAKGEDQNGYRVEFINLVSKTKQFVKYSNLE